MGSPKDIESILSEALKKKTAEEQTAFLDDVCGNDTELRSKIDSLLRASQEAASSNEGLPSDITFTSGTSYSSSLIEEPGTVIGPYKLLQLIGEGGFGAVYMAEQEKPIRRRVALKIIKLGMDTKQVIARFEAERQALALMDHPNIARVFDAGATDTGRPYFVMELIKGIPVTEYCDKNNLDTQKRLELFIDVCKAVQHAHQKGIIHRDIKPSNVMITLHDGKPVPKIIDFGIAKATQQRLTEKTLFTEYRQFVGTPEYMSPEQAEMCGLDIDTRTDIYSLGVLLYELLTGTTPFEADKLRSAAYDEIRRIIREDEPPKPSTRLSTLGEALTDIAKHRDAQPGELCKIVRGDMDWVVMRALEKDRTRRYETANELAMDIYRHRNDEPVSAGPPGVKYRLHKFIRRHKTGVAAGLLVAAAIVAGLVISTTMYFQAEQAREKEAAARAEAEQAQSIANEQRAATLKANRQLAWENYVAVIGLTQRLIKEENISKAKVLLAACPKEYRHWEWGHLQYLCNQDIKTIRFSKMEIHTIAFSRNGKRMIVGSGDPSVKVIDTQTEEVLMFVPGLYAALDPTDKYFIVWDATPGDNRQPGSMRIWEMKTGRRLHTFYSDSGSITCAAFSPDGKWVACGDSGGSVKIFDVVTGDELFKVPISPNAKLSCVAFSPDGQYIATGDTNWAVKLWCMKTEIKCKMTYSHTTEVKGLVFSLDSRNIFSVSAYGQIISKDIESGQCVEIPRKRWSESISIVTSTDGRYAAVRNRDETTSLLDLEKKAEIHRFKGTAASSGVSFTFDDGYLVTEGVVRGTIAYWDLKRLEPNIHLKGHTGAVNAIRFSPNGRLLATAAGNWNLNNDQTARIWDLRTGRLAHELWGHYSPVYSVAFSPDGNLLATGSIDELVIIWSVNSGRRLQTHWCSGKMVCTLDFHPSKPILASGHEDGVTRLWDYQEEKLFCELPKHAGRICDLAYSPDGCILATAGWYDRIMLWNTENEEKIGDFRQPGGMIASIDFSRDGKLLISSNYDGTVTLWDLATGKRYAVFSGHNSMVADAVLSSDNKRLFTVSRDLKAKVWDVNTKTELMTFGGDVYPSMALSPDYKTIAVGEGNDVVLFSAFPWREEDYPGEPCMPLEERIELYKRDYWQQPLWTDANHPMARDDANRIMQLNQQVCTISSALFNTGQQTLKMELAVAFHHLADALAKAEEYESAKYTYRQSIARSVELSKTFPEDPVCKRQEACSTMNLAGVLIKLGRIDEAETAMRRTVKLFEELVINYPYRTGLKRELADSLDNLGNFLRDTGRLEESRAAHEKAKIIRAEMMSRQQQ